MLNLQLARKYSSAIFELAQEEQQLVPYGEQLRFKTEQVRDQLTRIGRIALPEIAPCLGSARTQFYRNKLEFTFADRRWLTREEVERLKSGQYE